MRPQDSPNVLFSNEFRPKLPTPAKHNSFGWIEAISPQVYYPPALPRFPSDAREARQEILANQPRI
jgi:hypothetical protein